MKRGQEALGLGVLALGLAVVGIYAGRTLAPGRQRLNVIVLLADTLRADHLGSYGYPRPTTPNIDRFFSRGVVFHGARSQASCTYPSVNSILTSRYPTAFFGQADKRIGIPEGIPTMAEIFAQNGYATIALSASPIVRKTGTKYNNLGGFDRGFEVFEEQCTWREARCLNEKLLPILDRVQEPFFAYVHYMDPHDPYRPPNWYRKPYGFDYDGIDFVISGNPNPIADAIQWRHPMPEYQPQDLQHLIDLYDDEISYFDGEFEVLMADLATRGVLDRTIVVLASDHGEQFLEHGFMKHCFSLYDTDIHVPLALRIPGQAGGLDIFASVQNVDLAPTLLDYSGIGAENRGFDGRSLRPLIEGLPSEPAYAFAFQGANRSVSDGTFKLLYDAKKREFALYDLRTDPGERRDALQGNVEAFVRLEHALHEWEGQIAEGKTSAEMVAVGIEVQDRLRALGYLH